MKIVIFFEEMLSIIFTPFVLWFSLPLCTDAIIDFFREFTIHVDGLGYVCSFAVFDFKKEANKSVTKEDGRTQGLRDDYYSTKDGKMLKSYYSFIDNYVTNPKSRAPFPRSADTHNFHPPPTFPGLMSPILVPEVGLGNSRAERHDRQRRVIGQARQTGAGVVNQSTHRVPRFTPSGGSASPMTSVLLDPQHQPSRLTFKAGQTFGAQSRLRNSRRAFTNPSENEEEELHQSFGQTGVGESEGGTVDGSLGDSWKTTRAGNADDDGEEGIQTSNADREPGVLGLVYQFSKVQTDGRGTGVNI